MIACSYNSQNGEIAANIGHLFLKQKIWLLKQITGWIQNIFLDCRCKIRPPLKHLNIFRNTTSYTIALYKFFI